MLPLPFQNHWPRKPWLPKVNGELWDLNRPLEGDADVAIVTDRDPEALELIRHDAAHVLAQAVQGFIPARRSRLAR